jgi:hypothetical protein
MSRCMVFNATFNNISVISWHSVLLEETGVPGENHNHDAPPQVLIFQVTLHLINVHPLCDSKKLKP